MGEKSTEIESTARDAVGLGDIATQVVAASRQTLGPRGTFYGLLGIGLIAFGLLDIMLNFLPTGSDALIGAAGALAMLGAFVALFQGECAA